MIRLYNGRFAETAAAVTMLSERFIFDKGLWGKVRECFRRNVSNDALDFQLISIENEQHEVICQAWQDNEANRELRMLKELEENGGAFQFQDIFPEIREVVVCGCNELACQFAEYLEQQCIPVSRVGKYWELFGYEADRSFDPDGENRLVIYAEGIISQNGDFYQTAIRSVSPEFECIDRIYEANVLAGKNKDTETDFACLTERLKGKQIVLLGTDSRAQDVYDLLYSYGVDIDCFAGRTDRFLLGKRVVDVRRLLKKGDPYVFIDCVGRHSALGTENVDFFDYYGYRRNKNFFMIRDYIDFPYSNLIHVLRGKRIFLAGDERLCEILADYLIKAEQEEVDVRYVDISADMPTGERDVLCIINPWYGGKRMQDNPEVWMYNEKLAESGVVSYTDYFSSVKAFVIIDEYRNRNNEKYSRGELCPKGIFLGRIPAASGNVFFRGILDGHAQILKWGYNAMNNNLLFYCIRLANIPSEEVMTNLKSLLDAEFRFEIDTVLPFPWSAFEKCLRELLFLKESFTSQELFVLFHIAYVQAQSGQKVSDISQKVIYWEPHHFPRDAEFSFLEKWLESGKINGQTLVMHREHVVWTGSNYKFYAENPTSLNAIRAFAHGLSESDHVSCGYWKEFHVRFEDLKLHPERELQLICERLGISWSDTMLKTTMEGDAWDYEGIKDFDLKPVFNKYEEYLSEFDRFRISLLSSPYQKRYGYIYENCGKFSRRELQEMFLKPFRFQEKLEFADEKERKFYFFQSYEILRRQMWEARRHEILDDITPMFQAVEIGNSAAIQDAKKGAGKKKRKDIRALRNLTSLIKETKRLVLYGTGKDCESILECLNETEQSGLSFCDLKATYVEYSFHGKKVIRPEELCGTYRDCAVLITSSQYCKDIQRQLKELGVNPDRMICNTSQLWGRD